MLLYLFFSTDSNAKEPIASLPGVSRLGVNCLIEFLNPLVKKGLHSVLLFGVASDDIIKVLKF